MNTATPAPAPAPNRDAMLATLSASFPVIKDAKPLAIGIHKAIIARMPEINVSELKTALRRHTASTRYLKTLSNANERFDLDGNPAGEVTAEQRKQATDSLKERFRKGAERKKAEQAEKERQEKLLKLAEKFNKRTG